ncbi:quinone-dependent dihydroorotate dehydrogenase [Kineococcus rubinsiae]|uniref:quinone-dependent dihydroorotate dehydrogenase n=1 Tax=Kineococcus rubinsiae TaxID=2609562 RepID=UPI00142FBE5C|nr:quinone-dependent dihydroorotate dehydrogenase [Kineococcus rubinsiae]NIZ92518.1 quinone-dependent dihydroorotate dehydrogenase [Kineococcus rubinsiae]
MVYRALYRTVFTKIDPERAHHWAFSAMRAAARVPPVADLTRHLFVAPDPRLRTRVLGMDLPGPLGLAAGFDKDGLGVEALGNLGFCFVEVGTVTALPQPGNPRPRLARLTEDRAIVNRMGFNNSGAEVVARRLRQLRAVPPRHPVAIGVNIGKSKVVDEADAAADYATSARLLAPYADYLVVNVSSPNTPGLRDLQAVGKLRPVLEAVRTAADAAAHRHVPLLVKIAPDLSDADVDAVADLALETGLDGIVATNTTITREGLRTPAAEVASAGGGGLSGAPLKERSLAVLRRLSERTTDRLVLISVGGIETSADVAARLEAGASLVQAYTAFVYEGPAWPRRVLEGLAASRTRRESDTATP